MGNMQFFHSVAGIKQRFQSEGLIYFTPAGRRGFHSRILPRVYGGRVFVESVKSPSGVRWYAVKIVEWSERFGYSIDTIGDLMTTTNPNSAKRAARKLGDMCALDQVPDYLEYGMSDNLAYAIGFVNDDKGTE